MKIIIAGKPYSLDEAVSHPKLRDVKYLARASRTKDSPAVTPLTIQQMFKDLGDQVQVQGDGFDQTVWLMDDMVLANLQGVMWLARRKEGEDLTYDEAGDTDLTDFTFEDDEDPDPKDITGEQSPSI